MTSALLAVGTLLSDVLLGFADLAGLRTTWLRALLSTVTYAMTFLTTESTGDGGLLDRHDVLRTLALSVTELATLMVSMECMEQWKGHTSCCTAEHHDPWGYQHQQVARGWLQGTLATSRP